MTSGSTQPNFSTLEPHTTAWGLPTSEQRLAKRMASTIEELRSFYDAMLPRLPEIIDYLNQFPLDSIPEPDRPLGHAALAMCEVDNAVNKWGKSTLETGIDVRRMMPKKNLYDRGHG